MAYSLTWRDPAFDANKAENIQVPVGSIVSDKASLRLTGKGAANYGVIQQENLLRLLENFAGNTPPDYPTVGQVWYDTLNSIIKICASTVPLNWKSLAGIQITDIGEDAPSPAAIGDTWFKRTGSSSGTLYIYNGMGRYPEISGTTGGWNQVWPNIEIIAGREEYDVVLNLVNQLINLSDDGSGALGTYITNLTDFTTLDTDHLARYIANSDLNILSPVDDITTEITLNPNSNDWDVLLAAAKYAINRLELPSGYYTSISPIPFVFDGLQVPTSLLSLDSTDVRYPSLERRSNRHFGLITLLRLYTETLNTLQVAITNRYSIKGINGSSGSNTTFDTGVVTSTHIIFSGAAGGTSNPSLVLRFNFTDTNSLQSFLNSGSVIQLTMLHLPGSSGTSADTNVKTLLDTRGILRFTADKLRIFSNTLPLTLNITPINTGLKTAGVITTQTLAGVSYTITITSISSSQFSIGISIASAGSMNGTLSFKFEVIRDTLSYLAPAVTPVFSAPISYVSGDKISGSSFLV